MALTTELLTVLDDNEQPLKKRLRIANNAFISNELQAINKENVILEWISKRLKENNPEIWETLNACLMGDRLRPNDVKIYVLKTIITHLINEFKNSTNTEIKSETLKCAKIIIKNELFQHYFKHDTNHFCSFISKYLLNISDLNELIEIFKIYETFNRQIIIDGNYIEHFLNYVFDTFIKLIIQHKDSILFDYCMRITRRILFGFTSKDFKKYLDSIYQKDPEIETNIIIKKLNKVYQKDEEKAVAAFKLIFISFINAYRNDSLQIYQFFILIVRYIGFQIDDQMNLLLPPRGIKYNINLSLNILAELLQIISKENITMTENINEIKFSRFMNLMLLSIIRIHPLPNINTLKIIKTLIVINPVIITKIIPEILIYLINVKDQETQIYYSELMISLFEMYLKLHRLHKFCHELLKSFRDGFFALNDANNTVIEFANKVDKCEIEKVKNVGDIFPVNVRCYFQECVTLQTNKQIISMMRTFITNLNEIADNLTEYTEENQITYVEIVSVLTCEFLSAVRIAEHTTTELTIEKFFKDINDLKHFLKQFGSALLKMEHNQNLMLSFLNLCYNWGENAILLNYYIPNNNEIIAHLNPIDNTANNLTYLHNYLTTAQWSLVSQRIKNFGEQSCKRILQKLVIQKLRAVLIFEAEVNENLETSVIANYSSNLEACWDIILTERFISAKFFNKMETAQLITLADLLIADVLAKSDFKILANKSIIDSRDLVQTILYVCLSKINNMFKKNKRRQSNNTASIKKALITKIYENIDENAFIRNGLTNTEKLIELFNQETETMTRIKINEERFNNIMLIIKNIPVYSINHEIQITLFLMLLSICSQHELCEKYLIALVENTTSPNIFNNVKSHVLLKYIIERTQQYQEILNYSINKCLKQNETICVFDKCLELILENIRDERYLNVALITLHAINKSIKNKLTDKSKEVLREYKEKICKCLFDVVVDDNEKIEAYVLILQNYLNKTKEDDKLTELLSVLNRFIEYTIKNINETNAKGCLLLHELILTNKSVIKNIPSDFILSVWKSCKDLIKHENYSVNFDKTITLLFEHVSIEQFPIILNDLLKSSRIYLKNHELSKLQNQFDIWRNLISSALNASKLKLTQNSLQTMLEEIMLYIINNKTSFEFNQDFVKLQINIMENKQVPQSSNIIDVYLQSAQIIITKKHENPEEFTQAFDTSFPLLESFLKHRKILIIDRLPAFLAQLRNCIYQLCEKSNADVSVTVTRVQILKLANCAFRLEQLVKNICSLKKDVARVAPYLVADILKRYEKITLHPEVKNHFNNCLNYLIDLCDSHAVSYLLRALSPASRELFKNMHENYKKYYKFTGKV